MLTTTHLFAVIFKPRPYYTTIYIINMKKILFCFKMFTLSCLLLMSSCRDENFLQQINGLHNIVGNMNIYLEYLDSKDANLVQKDTPVAVFYEKDGIAQPVQRPYFDVPYGYTIKSMRVISPNAPDELCVNIFPSDYMNKENFSTTYLKLGNNSMDTIRCQFYNEPGMIYLLKIWLNGTLVWEHKSDSALPLIKIVK